MRRRDGPKPLGKGDVAATPNTHAANHPSATDSAAAPGYTYVDGCYLTAAIRRKRRPEGNRAKVY